MSASVCDNFAQVTSLCLAFSVGLDVTLLPAFAAERRRLQHGARSCRSIFPAHTALEQLTCRPPLLLSTDGTDRQTDGWTPDRYIDLALHAVWTVLVTS